MNARYTLNVFHVPGKLAGLLLGGLLLTGSGGWAAAAEPGGEGALAGGDCADLSGEYENRASAGSRTNTYLSNILGLSPGVTRVGLAREDAGMVVTAHLYTSGSQQMFFSWADFGCNGSSRVFHYVKSTKALSPTEGRPLGGSLDGQIAMEKTKDGSLLVRYSWSESWVAPALWGLSLQYFQGGDWARFEPYRK